MDVNTPKTLDSYRFLVGQEMIESLYEMALPLKGIKVVHINSTKIGGGVAEILLNMIPLKRSLEIDAIWEVIQGEASFFQCTKMFHNLMQGEKGTFLDPALVRIYEETNAKNAAKFKDLLEQADVAFIHDFQPLSLISHFPHRTGKWIWRCHVDLSSPDNSCWEYLKQYVDLYDGSIFSLEEFVPPLSHPTYVIPPSIDPLSEKNIELSQEEISQVFSQYKIPLDRTTLVQVSRFDKFKDPLGVIQAYQLVKEKHPQVQLLLAGGWATDDPESSQVLQEITQKSAKDSDIHILFLPPTSHRIINALQRGADIILQKSLKEGFGLTVSESLWKSKPVLGGNTGGIRLQIIDRQTGILATSIQEAYRGIEYFLQNPSFAKDCGKRGKELVQERFLITRHLKDYLHVILDHLRKIP